MKVPSKNKQDDRIGQFIHSHRNLLVIVCDPKTDKLMMAYKDKVVINRIVGFDKGSGHVVKNILRKSAFKSNIDKFISSLAQSLELGVKDGNDFYKWIDGALYNISRAIIRR